MPWEVEAFLLWSGNQGELARPANLRAGGALLGRCSRQAREQALRAESQGQEGAHPAWVSWQETEARAGKALIVSVPQWQGQNSASQKLAEPDPLAKSRRQTQQGLSLLPPAGPSFLPSGLRESQSLCTPFSLLRKRRGLLAPSRSGVPVRGPA